MITPYEWIEPSTLPYRGETTQNWAAFEDDVDPEIMERWRQRYAGACETKDLAAAMDNEPSQPASTKPKLTADEELEYLQNFQANNFCPVSAASLSLMTLRSAHFRPAHSGASLMRSSKASREMSLWARQTAPQSLPRQMVASHR